MEDRVQENQEKLTQREHPNRTRVTWQTKHHLTINASNKEHEATDNCALILSYR